ncbi:peptidylprolyl isomerase [Patescibacteria group bacterium]|nr:peptidylprolyl isomerase [Patescibacteria group bacterium]
MVINEIKNKVIEPIVYNVNSGRDNKDNEAVSGEEGAAKQAINEEELAHFRQAVLQEIQVPGLQEEQKDKPLIKKTKKFFKKDARSPKKKFHVPSFNFKLDFKKLAYILIKATALSFIFLFILTTIGIYLAGWQSGWVQTVVRFIPYPAAYIDGDFVTINDFLNDTSALESYLQRNNLNFTPTEVRDLAMEKLIEKEVIKQLASQSKITVTDQEIETLLAEPNLSPLSPEDLDQLVEGLYGWNFTTYIDKVIKPLILAKRLEDDFNQTSGNLDIKQAMEVYYNQLIAQPEDFEKIALEVNEDKTQALAGDLGWLKLGDLSLELEFVLLNLDNSQISKVIETDFGYHIIKLTERLTDDNGQLYFHAGHIFRKKSPFKDFLNEQIKKAKVVTLMRM